VLAMSLPYSNSFDSSQQAGIDWYTVFGYGGIYYAKDEHKTIVNYGTSCSEVVESILGAGRKIKFLSGIYEMLGLLVTYDNVELCGVGAELKGGSASALIAQDCNGLYVHDLILNSIGILATGSSANGIIRRVTAKKTANQGIQIEYPAHNWTVELSTIQDCYKEGIAIVNRATADYYNASCIIRNNTLARTGYHAILASGASRNKILNNAISDAGILRTDGFAHGIAFDGNGGLNPQQSNQAKSNTIVNCRMKGIESADGSHDVLINNNHVESTGESGVYFGGFLSPSHNCDITNNFVATSGWEGILLENASHVNVKYNAVQNGALTFRKINSENNIVVEGNSWQL
jgi:hypothetical protein